jgi:hypothetical protein
MPFRVRQGEQEGLGTFQSGTRPRRAPLHRGISSAIRRKARLRAGNRIRAQHGGRFAASAYGSTLDGGATVSLRTSGADGRSDRRCPARARPAILRDAGAQRRVFAGLRRRTNCSHAESRPDIESKRSDSSRITSSRSFQRIRKPTSESSAPTPAGRRISRRSGSTTADVNEIGRPSPSADSDFSTESDRCRGSRDLRLPDRRARTIRHRRYGRPLSGGSRKRRPGNGSGALPCRSVQTGGFRTKRRVRSDTDGGRAIRRSSSRGAFEVGWWHRNLDFSDAIDEKAVVVGPNRDGDVVRIVVDSLQDQASCRPVSRPCSPSKRSPI